MVVWAPFGMIFRAISWSIAILILANIRSALFFMSELISNLYMIALNILDYYFLGLVGLGMSFAITYIIYVVHIYFVCKKYLQFEFEIKLLSLSCIQIIYAIISVGIFYFCDSFYFISGLISLLSSILFSLYILIQRINLKKFINSKFSLS